MCMWEMLGERAKVLGWEGMTIQGGALLPWTPLLKDRVYLSGLWAVASPSLLHDLVEVGVDPSVSP